MSKKELFSNKDKLLLPIFVICLMATSIFIGEIILSFFISLVVIMLISCVYSIITVRHFNNELVLKIKHSAYVTCFSYVTSIIIAIALPYLIFQNRFYNWIEIQYLYLTPILFVFLTSLYLYSNLVKAEKPKILHTIKVSLLLTIIISILASTVSVGVWNQVVSNRSKWYNEQFDEIIPGLVNESKTAPDLQVFRELESYRINHINDAYNKKADFDSRETKLCIWTNCPKLIVDRAFHVLEVFVTNMISSGRLQAAHKEWEFIHSDEFDYDSFEKYAELLEANVSKIYANPSLNSTHQDVVDLVKTEFTYLDQESIFKSTYIKNTGSVILNLYNPEAELSILGQSSTYVMKHSKISKEIVKLYVLILTYTGQQGKAPDLLVELYENRNVEESTESKIIRYKLLQR